MNPVGDLSSLRRNETGKTIQVVKNAFHLTPQGREVRCILLERFADGYPTCSPSRRGAWSRYAAKSSSATSSQSTSGKSSRNATQPFGPT
jgi:hypothetical protein